MQPPEWNVPTMLRHFLVHPSIITRLYTTSFMFAPSGEHFQFDSLTSPFGRASYESQAHNSFKSFRIFATSFSLKSQAICFDLLPALEWIGPKLYNPSISALTLIAIATFSNQPNDGLHIAAIHPEPRPWTSNSHNMKLNLQIFTPLSSSTSSVWHEHCTLAPC